MTTTDLPAPGTATIHPRIAGGPQPYEGRDQRRVGLLFGVTGLTLFTVMALVGLLLRLSQGDVVTVSDAWFYRLMTLHAAGMLAGVLLAMMGGLWYVVRSTVPGLDFRVAMGAYASLLTGVVVVLVSTVIGGFAGAWTFLAPLPYESAGAWSTWAAVAFYIGMSLVDFAFMIYCISMLKAVTETYGGLAGALGLRWLRGRSDTPPPTSAIAATAVTVQGIAAGVAGMTIMAALLDRAMDDTVVIEPLWAKNVTYFFGHSVANLIIYLAAGMLYMLVPMYAGRPWKTSKPLVIGWLATITFVMTAYAHHLYMDFAQPGVLHAMGMFASSAAAIPVAVVTIYTAMMLVWGSQFRWTLSSLLFFLGFMGWAVGGVGAVLDSLIPVNFRLHNTLWVPAHFHSYLLMGVGVWVIGLVAYLLERACDRPAGRRTTVWGPVLMVLGGYGLTFAWYISGAMGVPRRWAVQPDGTQVWSVIGSVFAIIFLVGLFVVLAELIRMGREAWRLRGTRSEPEPAAVALAPVPGSGFRPMVTTYWGTVIAVAVGVAGLFVLYPPVNEMSEWTDKYHHLAHAFQFFVGAMLAAVAGSDPRIANRFGGRISTSLIVVAVAPVIMLLVMMPQIYKHLDDMPVMHAGYHLLMIAFGAVTGFACARLGRVAGWSVFWASIAMAVLFAPGVSGG